jgi:putative colanic acid biosynthesis acetyltransferase WcaF
VRRDLKRFAGGVNLTTLGKIRLGAWYLVQNVLFKSPFLPSSLRAPLLRLFGASVGNGVFIRRGVRIHFPWNLEIGNHCWIGEEVWFINHEKVTLGSNVCISQRSIICTGSHDFKSASLEYAHKSVEIKDGAWICLDSKILPGVSIGECSVVSAGETARKSLPDYSMLISGHVRIIEPPR